MDRQKLALSVAIILLGFACFVLACVSVAIPYWGTFRSRVREERGHFGPWTMCKDIGYGRDLCGQAISSFRLMTVVRAAGICAAIGTATLGLYCVASIFQISMQVTRSRILFHYHHIVFLKLVCSVCTAITTIAAVCCFAAQSDDLERGYIVEASFCFYMEVILAIFTFILMLLTIVEYTALRKLRINFLLSGAQDITKSNGNRTSNRHIGAKPRLPPSSVSGGGGAATTNLLPQMGFGTTIGNPGFRDAGGGIHTNGIAMTESSARFVPSVPSAIVFYNNKSNSLKFKDKDKDKSKNKNKNKKNNLSRSSSSNSIKSQIRQIQQQQQKHQQLQTAASAAARPLPPQTLRISETQASSSIIINNPNVTSSPTRSLPSASAAVVNNNCKEVMSTNSKVVSSLVGASATSTPRKSPGSVASSLTSVSSLPSSTKPPKSPGMSRLARARQLSIEKKERRKARKMIRAVVGNTGTGSSSGRSKSRTPPRSSSPAPGSSSAARTESKPGSRVKFARSLFNFRFSSSSHVPSSPSLSSTSMQNSSSDWHPSDSISIVPAPDSINDDNSTMSVISSTSTLSTLASTLTPTSGLPRGPLRSSLKKTKPPPTPDDSIDSALGIQNPGFSATSPTLSRTGSLKKVRIQTMSTDV